MVGQIFYSFVISQVFGLYLTIYSIIVLSRSQYYRELVNKIELPSIGIHNGATTMLFVGIFLVDIHNLWMFQLEVLVTILSWVILVKSVLWLALPEQMLAVSKRFVSGNLFYLLILAAAVVGLIMLSRGFYLYMVQENITLIQG